MRLGYDFAIANNFLTAGISPRWWGHHFERDSTERRRMPTITYGMRPSHASCIRSRSTGVCFYYTGRSTVCDSKRHAAVTAGPLENGQDSFWDVSFPRHEITQILSTWKLYCLADGTAEICCRTWDDAGSVHLFIWNGFYSFIAGFQPAIKVKY